MKVEFYVDRLSEYENSVINDIKIIKTQMNVFEFIDDNKMKVIFYSPYGEVRIQFNKKEYSFTHSKFNDYIAGGQYINDDKMKKYQTVLFDILNEPLIKNANKLF
jgi:hypothetical protein